MTRAFRNRMIRQLVLFLVATVLALLLCSKLLNEQAFIIAAIAIVLTAAASFNVLQRRAYAAQTVGKR